MANSFDRAFSKIKQNKTRREQGFLNSIPWDLKRFEEVLPGVEMARYYLITSNTKGGKSTIAQELFIYQPIHYILANPEDKADVKIFYFAMEESDEEIMTKTISRRIHRTTGKKIPPAFLMSKFKSFIPNEGLLTNISKDRDYYDAISSRVTIYDDIHDARKMINIIESWFKANGKFVKDDTGKMVYVPNNTNLYVLGLFDHIGLLAGQPTLFAAIAYLSKELVRLRNIYQFSPVVIQQQAMASESLDAVKQNRIEPTTDNLADNKQTARDANYIFGIPNPYTYAHMRTRTYKGYDVNLFRDNIRFIEIIRSRHGGVGKILPLLFDGGVADIIELPLPSDKKAIEALLKRKRLWRTKSR